MRLYHCHDAEQCQNEEVTSDMLASNSRQGAQWLEAMPKATPDNVESNSEQRQKI